MLSNVLSNLRKTFSFFFFFVHVISGQTIIHSIPTGCDQQFHRSLINRPVYECCELNLLKRRLSYDRAVLWPKIIDDSF